jgi:hypothetical protein
MSDQKFIFSSSFALRKVRWSQLYLRLQIHPGVLTTLASTNRPWARVLGNGIFSLWVIHMEGLCSSSGGINRLMMMTTVSRLKKLTFGSIRFLLCLSFTIVQHFASPPSECQILPNIRLGYFCWKISFITLVTLSLSWQLVKLSKALRRLAKFFSS